MRNLRLHHLAALALLTACGKSSTAVVVPDVATVEVTPATPAIEVGQTVQFAAQAFAASGAPIDGQEVTWASSSGSVASIDITGLATALTSGATQITATIGGVTSTGVTLTVSPLPCSVRTDVTLSPGEYAVFPGDECLLLPSGSAGDYYRVAVARPTLISDNPANVASVTLSMSPVLTLAAAGPDRAPTMPAAVVRSAGDLPRLDGARALENLRWMDATRAFEMQLRMRESQLGLDPSRILPSLTLAGAPADPPAIDSFYVNLDCAATVRRQVTRVGFNDNLAIYELTSEFSTDPINSVEAGMMLDYYDSYVKDMIVAYWGSIPDTDGNGRILVVTTNQLGDNVAAAVFTGDYYPTSDCGGSNEGEIIYFQGDLIRNLDASPPNSFALGVVAHEAKHVISIRNGVQRGSLSTPDFNDLWIEEGTADLSAEMASRIAWAATGGPAPDEPITGATILNWVHTQGETPEIGSIVDNLAGIVRSLSSQPNSVMNDPNGAPDEHSFYNMSWHWHRWLGDAYGNAASAPLADSAFFHELFAPTTPAGAASGEILLTGVADFDELFEDFVVAVSLEGSGFAAPHPITTWSFVDAGDVFKSPNPDGSYPWPVTATETRDPSGAVTSLQQYVDFGAHAYSGSVGPSGVRFHDFASTGAASAEIQVAGADDGFVIVTRLD